LNKWLRHIANVLCVVFGLLIIRASIWLYEPKFPYVFCSVIVFGVGILFIITGVQDYVKMIQKWRERRKREKELQERRERLRKLLEIEEKRREEQRRRTAELMKSLNRVVIEYPKMTVETTGQIFKRLGIKREKIRKVKPKKVIEIKKPKPEKPKYSTLEPLIQELLSKGELYIDRNMHYGKLRGKDIARALAKELKRRKIEYDMKMDDYDAVIKIRRR